MIRELKIKNYKSILDHTIELGRINVFIGENGCGKTNILEAVAMAGAALTDKLSVEELFNRGMRVAKPSIMRSSFPGNRGKEIVIECGFDADPSGGHLYRRLRIVAEEGSAGEVKWSEKRGSRRATFKLGSDPDAMERARVLADAMERFNRSAAENKDAELTNLAAVLATVLEPTDLKDLSEALISSADEVGSHALLGEILGDFAIYNASALALRGLQTVSRRAPLGIYGETLDYAISTLKPDVWADLLKRAKCVSWLEDVVVDPTDQLKYEGHKLGKSQSILYFHDKHMRRKNNIFSAENVNEGVLHVLFHLTLLVSEGTPRVLGIDNIDTALNPQLCRDLMKQLAELAVKHDKQALITTQNPSTLDGLNLNDDAQRLFVVYRNDEGHTLTKRIKAKPQPDGQKLKLSELWVRGHLGGIPRNF
ncbi:AAA family ATPase [Sorangium sp. KYC3313]|uniref:AAA family ATPase n=1 Tax=Sorangium sp. KYC3313 TaxID=3449740 RepID=UPI003F8A9505